MTDEEFIRSRAKMGWSRLMVADAIGMNYQKFRLFVKENMTDVEWSSHNSPVRQEMNRAQRGNYTDARRAAMEKAVIAAAQRRAVVITIGSLAAPVKELYALYSEYVTVTYKQVMWRLRKGDDPYSAMFDSHRPGVIGRKLCDMSPDQALAFGGRRRKA